MTSELIKTAGFYTILTFFAFVPTFLYSAASANTAANQTGITYECGDGVTAGECNFADLIEATKRVTNFMAEFALAFSVVVIAWAGFQYMTGGENAGKRKKANETLLSVVKGIVIILAAWLTITLILRGLGVGVRFLGDVGS